ncbi:carbon-nitrogen hydrolase [Aspergillus heterothallicus]
MDIITFHKDRYLTYYNTAICQSEPCWFDKDAAIAKSIAFIDEAKANGASLIAFSEVWVPGYPNFLWSGNYKENIPLVQKYMANSISAYGKMLAIRQTAAKNQIYVAFGFSERVAASLYLAQVLIGPDGNVLLHRRKTKPTHVERTLFGDSTGDSLTTVVETLLERIGMLNCWIHIAAWPFNGEYSGGLEPYSICREANEVTTSRTCALEGGVYVLVTNQPLSAAGAALNSKGQAFVSGPDGRQLTESTDPVFDGLIYCDIDLDQIGYAKHLTDPVGHYSRPDMLRLVVDDRPNHVVERADPAPNTSRSNSSMPTANRTG